MPWYKALGIAVIGTAGAVALGAAFIGWIVFAASLADNILSVMVLTVLPPVLAMIVLITVLLRKYGTGPEASA